MINYLVTYQAIVEADDAESALAVLKQQWKDVVWRNISVMPEMN